MNNQTALKMAEAAHAVLRDRTPPGQWTPSLVVVAEALNAALHTRRQLEDNFHQEDKT